MQSVTPVSSTSSSQPSRPHDWSWPSSCWAVSDAPSTHARPQSRTAQFRKHSSVVRHSLGDTSTQIPSSHVPLGGHSPQEPPQPSSPHWARPQTGTQVESTSSKSGASVESTLLSPSVRASVMASASASPCSSSGISLLHASAPRIGTTRRRRDLNMDASLGFGPPAFASR
jgi:hypothetical protein